MTVDLDAVDLTALTEAVARRVTARVADDPWAWDDLTAMQRHDWRETVLPLVHDTLAALREGAGR